MLMRLSNILRRGVDIFRAYLVLFCKIIQTKLRVCRQLLTLLALATLHSSYISHCMIYFCSNQFSRVLSAFFVPAWNLFKDKNIWKNGQITFERYVRVDFQMAASFVYFIGALLLFDSHHGLASEETDVAPPSPAPPNHKLLGKLYGSRYAPLAIETEIELSWSSILRYVKSPRLEHKDEYWGKVCKYMDGTRAWLLVEDQRLDCAYQLFN